jgi:hypothetical protein
MQEGKSKLALQSIGCIPRHVFSSGNMNQRIEGRREKRGCNPKVEGKKDSDFVRPLAYRLAVFLKGFSGAFVAPKDAPPTPPGKKRQMGHR